MPAIDIAAVPARKGSGYPPPFDAPCAARTRRRLGDAGGLRDFGVNLMTLPPGSWSSQRHWHSHEDELVYVLEGEVALIEDGGETVLRAGDCATFPKGTGNGHHLINKSSAMAVYLEVGSRNPHDLTTCSDIDMMSSNADGRFVHKDGTPYPSVNQHRATARAWSFRAGARVMKTVVALLMLVLGLASPLARGAGCIIENDEIGVIGTLSRETFAGPPNYESVDRGDKAETYWILTLREPLVLCPLVDRDGKPHTVGSVNRFQLVINEEQRGLIQALIARHAAVRGRVFLRHTGHHHTAALIEVQDLHPATQSSLRVR